MALYCTQGASYAWTLAAVTDEPVARVTFVFLTPKGAIERDLPELAEVVREIERGDPRSVRDPVGVSEGAGFSTSTGRK